jgi:hypothetical protein
VIVIATVLAFGTVMAAAGPLGVVAVLLAGMLLVAFFKNPRK